jgi:hypothetical protein
MREPKSAQAALSGARCSGGGADLCQDKLPELALARSRPRVNPAIPLASAISPPMRKHLPNDFSPENQVPTSPERCALSSGECTRLACCDWRLADRFPVRGLRNEEHFGGAPKWAREARALPGVSNAQRFAFRLLKVLFVRSWSSTTIIGHWPLFGIPATIARRVPSFVLQPKLQPRGNENRLAHPVAR